jgi:hypothetical protein
MGSMSWSSAIGSLAGLVLLAACSRSVPPQPTPLETGASTDAGREIPQVSKRDASYWDASQWDAMTVFQRDYPSWGNGTIHKARYRKPLKTVPDEYRRAQGKDGTWSDVRILEITCTGSECNILLVNNWNDGEVLSKRDIARSSLTWLATTDLLGLPEAQGGRRPLPEGEEVPPLPARFGLE